MPMVWSIIATVNGLKEAKSTKTSIPYGLYTLSFAIVWWLFSQFICPKSGDSIFKSYDRVSGTDSYFLFAFVWLRPCLLMSSRWPDNISKNRTFYITEKMKIQIISTQHSYQMHAQLEEGKWFQMFSNEVL